MILEAVPESEPASQGRGTIILRPHSRGRIVSEFLPCLRGPHLRRHSCRI